LLACAYFYEHFEHPYHTPLKIKVDNISKINIKHNQSKINVSRVFSLTEKKSHIFAYNAQKNAHKNMRKIGGFGGP